MGSDGKTGPTTDEAVPAAVPNGATDDAPSPEAPGDGEAGPAPAASLSDGRHRRLTGRVVPRIIGVARPRAERLASFLRYPPSGRLLLRLTLAAAIVVAAVLTNRTFLGWGLFATCAVLLVPIGRTRSFILSFVPYAMVWFVFTALRSLADETTLARVLNSQVARFERWLFGGQLPTIMLQERFFDAQHLRLHDFFLTGVHWSYYLIPHIVAIRLWQTNPALFRHYLSAMTLLLTVGLAIYFLIPSNPPWLAPDPVNSPAAAQVTRVMEPIGKALGGGLYRASYRVIGESNPIAAMPSIHMAVTFLLPFAAGEGAASRRWRLLAFVYSALMGFALIYLGEHYVVDIAVGMLITAYAWFAAGYWIARIVPVVRDRFARPIAPREVVHGVGA